MSTLKDLQKALGTVTEDPFSSAASKETIIELKKAAAGIKHCGEYGRLYFNPSAKEVWWTSADGDCQGDLTSAEDIEKALKVKGVSKVTIEAETSPVDIGTEWEQVQFSKEDLTRTQSDEAGFPTPPDEKSEGYKFGKTIAEDLEDDELRRELLAAQQKKNPSSYDVQKIAALKVAAKERGIYVNPDGTPDGCSISSVHGVGVNEDRVVSEQKLKEIMSALKKAGVDCFVEGSGNGVLVEAPIQDKEGHEKVISILDGLGYSFIDGNDKHDSYFMEFEPVASKVDDALRVLKFITKGGDEQVISYRKDGDKFVVEVDADDYVFSSDEFDALRADAPEEAKFKLVEGLSSTDSPQEEREEVKKALAILQLVEEGLETQDQAVIQILKDIQAIALEITTLHIEQGKDVGQGSNVEAPVEVPPTEDPGIPPQTEGFKKKLTEDLEGLRVKVWDALEDVFLQNQELDHLLSIPDEQPYGEKLLLGVEQEVKKSVLDEVLAALKAAGLNPEYDNDSDYHRILVSSARNAAPPVEEAGVQTLPNGVELEFFGNDAVANNVPDDVEPYALEYCDNVEREGEGSYRFENVQDKKGLIAHLSVPTIEPTD